MRVIDMTNNEVAVIRLFAKKYKLYRTDLYTTIEKPSRQKASALLTRLSRLELIEKRGSGPATYWTIAELGRRALKALDLVPAPYEPERTKLVEKVAASPKPTTAVKKLGLLTEDQQRVLDYMREQDRPVSRLELLNPLPESPKYYRHQILYELRMFGLVEMIGSGNKTKYRLASV
jgi:hypothetical protein